MMTTLGLSQAMVALLMVLVMPRSIGHQSFIARHSVMNHKLDNSFQYQSLQWLRLDHRPSQLSLAELARRPMADSRLVKEMNPHRVFPQYMPTRTRFIDVDGQTVAFHPAVADAKPSPKNYPFIEASDRLRVPSRTDGRQREQSTGDWVSDQVALKPTSGTEIVDRIRRESLMASQLSLYTA